MHTILAALLVASLATGVARAEDAAPAEPTAGDRLANSGFAKGMKRASDSVGSGVGGALDAAGRATGRANAAVNRGFDAFDGKMTGWLGKLGFKPTTDEERAAAQRERDRRED